MNRRALRVFTSAVLAAGLAATASLPAGAASGVDVGPARPASTSITPGTGPVSLAVIAPIVVPPTTTGLLTADELEVLTGLEGDLTQQLDAVAGTPVAIALDPQILASIRVLGSAAPESARQWLARLGALSNDVFLLAYGDADLVAAIRTGTLDALEPTGFDFALDPANFAPIESPEPTPTPSPTPTATPTPTPPVDPDVPPPFPTTEDLLAWESTLPRIAWPSGSLGAGELPALVEAGYEQVLLPSGVVGEPSSPLLDLDGLQGVVIDAGLSESLIVAAGAASPAARASALDALETQLAEATATHPGRGVVAALDRTWPYAQPGLRDALARLASSSSATLVTLGDILGTTPIPGALGDGTPTEERDETYTALAEDAAAELAFSSVLEDPAVLLEPRALERIALYASAWRADETGWRQAVDAFRTRSDEIVTSVKLEQGSDMALLAAHANVKIAVSNSLPYPVTVRVTADPQGAILRVLEDQLITVEPESTTSAQLPVEAVANGQVTMLTSLETPTGVVLDAGRASVTVHAEWEGIGTLVVALVLGFIFVAGLLRLILIRRRARRAPDATPEASDG